NPGVEEPGPNDLFTHGTIAKIIQTLKLPNGLMKILVDGVARAVIASFEPNKDFLKVKISLTQETDEMTQEIDALMRHVSSLFSEYVHLNHNVPSEAMVAFENIRDPRRKLYYVSANISQSVEAKQKILELATVKEQYFELIRLLSGELDVLKIEK